MPVVLMLLLGCSIRAAAQECRAPELVVGAREYNALVCQAVARYDARDFAGAATLLDRATALQLHEYPNLRALPRLALARARLGQFEVASRILSEAARSFEVYYRISRCSAKPDGFDLVVPQGSAVPETTVRAVVARMCGEAFEGIYEQVAFDALVADLPLLQMYAEAQALVARASPMRH
jgi:hypothetical protein